MGYSDIKPAVNNKIRVTRKIFYSCEQMAFEKKFPKSKCVVNHTFLVWFFFDIKLASDKFKKKKKPRVNKSYFIFCN